MRGRPSSRKGFTFLAGALACLWTTTALADCTTCSNPSYDDAVITYPTVTPTGLAVGDLNGDGYPDVVSVPGPVTPLGDPTVAIFLGTGTGNLRPASYSPVASGVHVAIADFNADGTPDIVTTGALAEIDVLLGVGDGTFQPVIVTSTASPLYGPPLALDVNGDGFPDLVAATPGGIVAFLGNGDGTFRDPISLPDTLGANAFVVADFDGDGFLDVASNARAISVSLGNGDGSFRPPVVTAPAQFGLSVAADFDSDGIPDLASTDFDGNIVVYLGRGDGTFRRGNSYLVEFVPPTGIASGDFNGDGRTDIAIPTQQGWIAIFLGVGDGTLRPSGRGPTYTDFQPNAVAAADLDRNGSDELLVGGSGRFSVYQGIPPLGIGVPGTFLVTHIPISTAVADFSGDGRPDIAVAFGTFGLRGVDLLAAKGDGTFEIVSGPTFTDNPTRMLTTDLTGDGKPDLVAATDAGITAFVGKGDSTFDTFVTAGPAADFIALDDFDGDGKPDVVTSINASSVFETDIYLGKGDGTFAGPTKITDAGGPIAVGRFDGDAHPDLAISVGGDHLQILLGDGSGGFSPGQTIAVPGFAGSIGVGDFTGDGKVDLVVEALPSGFVVFPGKGDGTFGEAIATPVDSNLYLGDLRVVDVNGDGKLDLFVVSSTLFLGNGDGTFRESSSFFRNGNANAYAVADVDGDGRLDLVFGDYYRKEGSSYGLVRVLSSTQCEARRLVVTGQPTSCDVPGSAFETQPVVKVFDDGDNVVACDTGTVTASIAAGTGSPGAVLQGTAAVAAVAGVATFPDLGIDLAGRGYRLEFSHPLAGTTRSRTLSQGLTVALNGPALTCDSFPPTYRTGAPGYDRYVWKLDEVEVSRGPMPTLAGLSTGDHTLEVDVFQDDCTASQSRTITVQTGPAAPSIGAPLSVPAAATGLLASVTSHPGSSYHWSLLGGTITAGQGTEEVTFTAGPAGTTMTLEAIEVSAAGCESPADHARIQVDFADVPLSDPFHDAVNAMARNGISHGCGGGSFCPDALLTRDQMAIFLLKTEHGGNYQPPPFSTSSAPDSPTSPQETSPTPSSSSSASRRSLRVAAVTSTVRTIRSRGLRWRSSCCASSTAPTTSRRPLPERSSTTSPAETSGPASSSSSPAKESPAAAVTATSAPTPPSHAPRWLPSSSAQSTWNSRCPPRGGRTDQRRVVSRSSENYRRWRGRRDSNPRPPA